MATKLFYNSNFLAQAGISRQLLIFEGILQPILMKLKAGIFCGGPSRERGRSFEKARSVFQKLDQRLFEPVVFFIDIKLQLYQCDPAILYHKNLKALFGKSDDDFAIYQESLQDLNEIQKQEVYWKIGRHIQPDQLSQLINIAFIETWADEQVDSWLLPHLIEYRIPYMGVDAAIRKLRTQKSQFLAGMKKYEIKHFYFHTIDRKNWASDADAVLKNIQNLKVHQLRISPDQQHDLFADAQLESDALEEDVKEALDRAFFQEVIPIRTWRSRGYFDRIDHIRHLTHARMGLGFPIQVNSPLGTFQVHHPQSLLDLLEAQTAEIEDEKAVFKLISLLPAEQVLIEGIPAGTSFEVLLLEDEKGQPLALYPQLSKLTAVHKMGLTQLQLDQIRLKAGPFYEKMTMGPVVLLKGIYTAADQVVFDVPDISCSFEKEGSVLKHWAAYHLDSHQLMMYYVMASLQKRFRKHPEQKTNAALIEHLQVLRTEQEAVSERPEIAVLYGGDGAQASHAINAAQYFWEVVDGLAQFPVKLYNYDAETRKLEEKEPAALLLAPQSQEINPDWTDTPLYAEVSMALNELLKPFGIKLQSSSRNFELQEMKAGFVYPVLAGNLRSGTIQQQLEKHQFIFNGAGSKTLEIVNQKSKMMHALARNGCLVPKLMEVTSMAFSSNLSGLIQKLESQFVYPICAHPGDEDQATLRYQINTRTEFIAYAQLLFRPKGSLASTARKTLRIKDSEAVPTKDTFWVEEIPDQSWIPLWSSLYCSRNNEGEAEYEILEHSILQKNNLATPAGKELPAINRPEVQIRLGQELEKIARLLNLQSFVTIESYLRIFADNSIQLMLSQVDALPLLTPDHPLLAHAMLAGRDPGQVFQEMYLKHLKQYLTEQKTTFEPTMVSNDDENKEAEEQPISYDPPPAPVQMDVDKEASAFKKTWASIKAFLISPIFWKNVGGIFAAGLLLFGLILFLLGRYTLHGSSYIVDDYVDMKFDDAKRKARGKSFRAVVIDSIFITGAEPNIVTDQDPAPGSKVKKRRTIYMWVTGGQAPEILLPNLAGKDDFETYRRELERRNIRLVIKERKFDRKLQENTLLGFYYKGENVSTEMVNEGYKVVEGSTLEAIVSERISDELPIPNLVCETFEAAKFTIEGSRLVLGEVYGTRVNNAFVWKQEPAFEAGVQIKTGTVIKLHLTSELPEECQ